jgi:hypothetical protein
VFVSSEIEKGIRWSDEIKRALSTSGAGLVCLAWESRHSAWINFEAGALANAVDSTDITPDPPSVSVKDKRVYPYLLDIEPSDVPAPLQQFNVTRSSKEETQAMVRSVANLQGDDESWIDRFQENWPALANKLIELRLLSLELAVPGFFKLFDRNTFMEAFPDNPRTWLDRYFAARQTYALLEEADPIVSAHCGNEVKEGFERIRNYAKEYAMFAIPYLFDAQTQGSMATALREVEDRRRGICQSVERLKIAKGSSANFVE